MRYEIYEGSIMNVKNVLMAGRGTWINISHDLDVLGYTRDPYIRVIKAEDADYCDFGSWSVFVKIYRD